MSRQPMTAHTAQSATGKPNSTVWSRQYQRYQKHKYFYLMLVPLVVYYLIFEYGPLYGVQIAFKDYMLRQGIWGSPWVGWKHFEYMFTLSPDFYKILGNTVIISLYHIIFGFPAPIILALLLNELRLEVFKQVSQTISYLPHFLSWIVLGGMLITILSPTTGAVNIVLGWFGIEPIYFLGDPHYFRFTLVVSAIWKEIGWGTIIYLAALAGIDPYLYEAAKIDGANRWKQTVHITLPSIMHVVAILFIFKTGSILSAGFDQIFNLYNPAVYSVADILDTYVYRVGLTQLQYSFTTAVGLFKNIVAFSMVMMTNFIVKKMGQEGIL
ncbi:putative multiple-sugar transport system permease YteP [Paenibacillus konkukensis]|uniref:Multiple-sugar transport system permease YteP n=1 Tax=Paenibacillus konkukensis TaxID=2020716 RepID=A0ABY4S1G2_9BACL|nr:ABC transporter permease subunit [Paenibacillus konkukensis]UQZ87536.1 putative multiple-sugar transport system permease YteP [Paenibacillus konkukensis]